MDIVTIYFAFKNGPIISNLIHRGALIADGKFDKVGKIEKDTNKLVET